MGGLEFLAAILFSACLSNVLASRPRDSYSRDVKSGHTDLDTFLKKVLNAQDDLKWIDRLSKQMNANNAANSMVSTNDHSELLKTAESQVQDRQLMSEENVVTNMNVAGSINSKQHQPGDTNKDRVHFVTLDNTALSKDRRDVVNDQSITSSESKEPLELEYTPVEDEQDSVISNYWDNHGRRNVASVEEGKPRLIPEKKVDQEHQRLQLEDADGLLKKVPGSPLIGSTDNQMELNKHAKPPFDILKPIGYPVQDVILQQSVDAKDMKPQASDDNINDDLYNKVDFGESPNHSSNNVGYYKEESERLKEIEHSLALKPSNQDNWHNDKSPAKTDNLKENDEALVESNVHDEKHHQSDYSSLDERSDNHKDVDDQDTHFADHIHSERDLIAHPTLHMSHYKSNHDFPRIGRGCSKLTKDNVERLRDKDDHSNFASPKQFVDADLFDSDSSLLARPYSAGRPESPSRLHGPSAPNDAPMTEREKRRAIKRPGAIWQAEQDSDESDGEEEGVNPDNLEVDHGEKLETLNDNEETENDNKKTKSGQLQDDAERLKASYKSLTPSLADSRVDVDGWKAERDSKFANAEDFQTKDFCKDIVENKHSRVDATYISRRKRREAERRRNDQIGDTSHLGRNLVGQEYEGVMPRRRSLLSISEGFFRNELNSSPLSNSVKNKINVGRPNEPSGNAVRSQVDLKDACEAAMFENKSPVLKRVKRLQSDDSSYETGVEESCEENPIETKNDVTGNPHSKRNIQERNRYNFIPMDIITTDDESEYEDILGANDFRHKQEDEDEDDYKSSDQHTDKATRKDAGSMQTKHSRRMRHTESNHEWHKRDTRRVNSKRTSKRHKKEDEDEEEYRSINDMNGNRRRSLVVEVDEKHGLKDGAAFMRLPGQDDQDENKLLNINDDIGNQNNMKIESDQQLSSNAKVETIKDDDTERVVNNREDLRDSASIVNKNDVIVSQKVFADVKSTAKVSDSDKEDLSDQSIRLNPSESKDSKQVEIPLHSENILKNSNHSISARGNLNQREIINNRRCSDSKPCPTDFAYAKLAPCEPKCLAKEPKHKGCHRTSCSSATDPDYNGDLDDGQLGMNIVNTIYQHVEKTPCFKDYIGSGLKCRNRPTVIRESSDYHLRSEDMMHIIMSLIDESVECEVRRRTCNHLPCDLKEFMNWLMRNETQPLTPRDPFLFRKAKTCASSRQPQDISSCSNNTAPSPEDITKMINTLDTLVATFDDMDDDGKCKSQRIHDYLIKQINFLKSFAKCEKTTTDSSTPENPVNDDAESYGNPLPNKRNQVGSNEEPDIDMIEEDLESLGLGQKLFNSENMENKFISDPKLESKYLHTANAVSSIEGMDEEEQEDQEEAVSDVYKELMAKAAELRRKKRLGRIHKRNIVSK